MKYSDYTRCSLTVRKYGTKKFKRHHYKVEYEDRVIYSLYNEEEYHKIYSGGCRVNGKQSYIVYEKGEKYHVNEKYVKQLHEALEEKTDLSVEELLSLYEL